jgi:hypothetical protein
MSIHYINGILDTTGWIKIEAFYNSTATRFYIFWDWCDNNLEKYTWTECFGVFKFKYEIDAVAFKLKFGL